MDGRLTQSGRSDVDSNGKGVILRVLRLPPVIFLAFLIAGSAMQVQAPLTMGVPSFRIGMIVGGVMQVVAVALAWSAIAELRRHRTTFEPGEQPTSLVTRGIFAFSRNPMYLALVLVLASLAVMADSLWLLLSAALLCLTLDRAIVRTEEQILEETFPEAYLAYRKRVRRWF